MPLRQHAFVHQCYVVFTQSGIVQFVKYFMLPGSLPTFVGILNVYKIYI